jgi:ABC-type sugar transport system permease subunit
MKAALVKFKEKTIKWLDSYEDIPKGLRKGKLFFIFAMSIVPIISFIVFYLLVNLSSIQYGFQFNGEWSLLNYQRFWMDITGPNSQFLLALKNTLMWFVLGLCMMPVVFILTYFFYKKIPGYNYFRVIIFLPNIVSGIVTVTVFKNVIAPNGPIFSLFEQWFGMETAPSLITEESTANLVMVFFTIWTGFTGNLLLYNGTMNRLPKETLESARLDGVNVLQELWYIIVPMCWSTLSTLVVLGMTGIFSASGPLLLFTDGNYDTMTIGYWIFKQVKDAGSFEYPSAVGLIFTVVNLPIVLLVWHFAGKSRYNETEY